MVDSYIVRIYRYNPRRPEQLVGVIQTPGSSASFAFTGVEELWSALQQAWVASIPADTIDTPDGESI